MAYDPATLHPGDVLLVTGSGSLLDAAIRWSTDSPFVHAAIVGCGGSLIESAWPRVEFAPRAKYAATGWRFEVTAATSDQRYAAVAWARRHVGDLYGVKEILLDAARFDLHWLPRRRLPLRRLTCSALVAGAYLAAGVRLTWAPFPSPADLAASPLLVGPRPRA